jgi:hypothetical protein
LFTNYSVTIPLLHARAKNIYHGTPDSPYR